ncbi:MAG: phosphatase [Gammaproteobacteria bacterium]|nr:MAG: phosphatase [Gammaproteobacteria bacterium]
MNSFEAYLFDVDGTLADTERDGHLVAFNKAFADAGLSWNWSIELYLELLAVTGGKERMLHYLEKYDPPFEDVSLDLEDYFASIHASKTDHFKDMVDQGAVALRPGIERFLNEARAQKRRLAISTTTTFGNVTALLANTLGKESIDWFELIAAGDIVAKKKPAPDVYHYTLKEMGLAAEQCLVFEDSRNGILASKGANLTTVITVNDFTSDHDFNGAELIVSNLGEPGSAMQVIGGRQSQLFDGVSMLDVVTLDRLR